MIPFTLHRSLVCHPCLRKTVLDDLLVITPAGAVHEKAIDDAALLARIPVRSRGPGHSRIYPDTWRTWHTWHTRTAYCNIYILYIYIIFLIYVTVMWDYNHTEQRDRCDSNPWNVSLCQCCPLALDGWQFPSSKSGRSRSKCQSETSSCAPSSGGSMTKNINTSQSVASKESLEASKCSRYVQD